MGSNILSFNSLNVLNTYGGLFDLGINWSINCLTAKWQNLPSLANDESLLIDDLFDKYNDVRTVEFLNSGKSGSKWGSSHFLDFSINVCLV